MGKLARFGIMGGARVALRDLGCLPESLGSEDFATRALAELGFGAIRVKVAAGAGLEVPEIETLAARAPLSVLMKLVEIGRHSTSRVAPTPIVALSLAGGATGASIDYLGRIEHPVIEVLLEGVDLNSLGAGLEESIALIAQSRPGLTLVGPAAEDILVWLRSDKQSARTPHELTLGDVVERLRGAGVQRLRACRDVAALAAVNAVGVRQSFCTAIDTLPNPRAIAEHLAAIDELSQRDGLINVWFPGLSRLCQTFPFSGAALDLLMLRLLALGTVCLPTVPRRRASSQYLSLEAFNVAHLCGANDFGFGVLDGETEDFLRLKQLGALHEAFPAPEGESPDVPASSPQGRKPEGRTGGGWHSAPPGQEE